MAVYNVNVWLQNIHVICILIHVNFDFRSCEGGILDPNDRVIDVCDDREQLQAIFDGPQQPQSLPPSTSGNTSVAPGQMPFGSKPAVAKSILPLPPASSSSANKTGEGTGATSKQIVQPPNAAAAVPVVQEKNPFKRAFERANTALRLSQVLIMKMNLCYIGRQL